MSVDVIIEDEAWRALDLPGLAERGYRAVSARLGLVPEQWDLAVMACDDARIAVLNSEFRGKPTPTNVLSWPSAERATPGRVPDLPVPDPIDPHLGDIAIAYGTCAAEAGAAGRAVEDHVTHLMIHGILHLLGYDHETDADAAIMEGLEREVLAGLGLADPYS